MTIKNINGSVYSSYDIDFIVRNVLADSGIQQGIVGIKLPESLGVTQEHEFCTQLFYLGKDLPQGSIQVALIPPPLAEHFDFKDKVQMEALGRRIQRDHDDGIRYNRVYIAIYTNDVPMSIAQCHDLFIELEPFRLETAGKVMDNRK